ncbi:MAG: UDP-N-acetylmuramate--L-alanine ligase [Treponema sp.]
MVKISLPGNLKGVHVHFVGIKGTGMAALVEILHSRGAVITGSDVSERFYTDDILDRLGLTALPFSESNITKDIQYVIYSSAYNPEKNPDLIAAGKQGIPCMLYTQALGAVSEQAYSCGVCGVHGKTSTTGLVGTILKQLDLPAQVLAGSVITSFGGSCTLTTRTFSKSSRNYFVAETCEYQRHFMAFCPQKIILTSVESDHQDYYPTYNDIRDAFVDYICKLPEHGQLVYCADDKGAVEAAGLAKSRRPDIDLVPYGEQATGRYHLTFGKVADETQHFTIDALGELELHVPGRHDVRDACAASALVCELLKTDGRNPVQYTDKIRKGLSDYRGGKRRSEVIGKVSAGGNSVIFIDDYGHHPTAIKTTLAGYREFYSGRKILLDFMSHTYTRTAALLEDFARSFGSADEVILHKIYASAREDPSSAPVTGEILAEHAKKYHDNVHYYKEILDAKDFALAELMKNPGKEYPKGYLFVTMGAGDNWKIGRVLLEELKK